MIPGGLFVIGMHPGIGCSGSSIDHMAGFPGPLESAIEALSFGIGLRGQFQDGMRRIVRQVHQERLFVGIALRMVGDPFRSEVYTSELQSLMRISYATFCLT